jgi:hypothetical protein
MNVKSSNLKLRVRDRIIGNELIVYAGLYFMSKLRVRASVKGEAGLCHMLEPDNLSGMLRAIRDIEQLVVMGLTF